jgi:hypothetical protein
MSQAPPRRREVGPPFSRLELRMAGNFVVYKPSQPKVRDITAKILLKDPLVERHLPQLGRTTVTVSNEACIGAGPTSSRVAVVDYNGQLNEVFQAARLHSDLNRYKVRNTADIESDFAFHQVNVWATIHHTLELLEAPDVLGRRIPWAFTGGRLKVLPHAGYWENAYYDRETGALHFFYFESSSGEQIYTCLSHDIIAHELGHAVLDGLKPYYNEVTSAATAGFHEYFGDAIALTAALSHREIIEEVAGRNDSVTSAHNILAHIGQQFGSGLSEEYGSLADAYLRTAQNNRTMDSLRNTMEEHDYSELMTGAYYDLLERVYTKILKPGENKKAHRRFAALYDAARVVRRMMLRALDYCPPVDVNYLDYARAVARADRTAYPIDQMGYREKWEAIMRRRKVIPKTGSWQVDLRIRNSDLRGLDIVRIASSNTDAGDFLNANRGVLKIPPLANIEVINLYRTQKVSSDDYRVPQEIIIEFIWAADLKLAGKKFGPLNGKFLPLWCGGTLVFNRDGNLLHYALKEDDAQRRKALTRYALYLLDEGYLSFDDGERGVGAQVYGPGKVMARVVDGRVSFRRVAAMRHYHHD